MTERDRLFFTETINQPHMLPPLALAYIGDAVYELCVRTHLISRGITRTDKMHTEAVGYVCAETQAEILKSIEDILTEEEAAVAKRGRNAKSPHTPRGASVLSYRRSTGLECLVGYLFLSGKRERLAEIMERVFSLAERGR